MARAHTAGQSIDQHHLPREKLNHQNVDPIQAGFKSPGLIFSELGQFLCFTLSSHEGQFVAQNLSSGWLDGNKIVDEKVTKELRSFAIHW